MTVIIRLKGFPAWATLGAFLLNFVLMGLVCTLLAAQWGYL
jgi:hypothetical protein